MSNPKPDFTPLASVQAKLKLSEQLIQSASQKLHDPNLSDSKRAELQKTIEEVRRDMVRFQRQKDDLDTH